MDATTTIMVSGANGQLGKELQRLAAEATGFHFIFLSRDELPVEDANRLSEQFRKYQPDYYINCAAYTAVDKAESEPELAFQVNAEAVGTMATRCHEYNTRFIHISTDYVFNGEASQPYTEEAPVNPQSVYGASKLKGEELALEHNPSAVIIRTSWVYSEFGKNFLKTMLRLFKEKDEIGVVNDQWGSPTYAGDLAMAIVDIIKSGKWEPGIYHYCNEGIISWYEFASWIKESTGAACTINPITTVQYPTPAKRPAYSALDTNKIRKRYGLQTKDWKQSVTICLRRVANQ